MAGTWRAIGRFTHMLWHSLKGVHLARNGFHQLDAQAQQRAVERWAREFLDKAGIALRVEGWRPAWEALRAAANLPPLVQSGIAAMLENLSRQSANPEVLDLDLVMEGGMMRLGPMPLGPAPRLR